MTRWKVIFASLGVVTMTAPATAQITKEEFDKKLAEILANPQRLKEERARLGLDRKPVAERPARMRVVPPPDAVVEVPARSGVSLLQKNTPSARGASSADENKLTRAEPAELSPCAG